MSGFDRHSPGHGVEQAFQACGKAAMGPFWEDATPITFADLLAVEVGGFVPPPGYKE